MTGGAAPSRRHLLALGVAAAWLAPGRVRAAAGRERSLALRSLHTGERVVAVYWADGGVVAEGLAAIERVLRDHRTGEAHAIDRALLDLLVALRTALDTRAEYEIISGYRSPRSNALLVRATSGVARDSLHVRGMAIDVRLPGRPLRAVRDAAASLRAGGVGFYPASGFVHIDVGRVRYW
jgi:uncharacterized protein YcbK (DUF882 family)